ncbi:hypothetical protein F443_03093 [Phytophthora nicotianae P1569]|uniref:Uncharacterized protein n=1 Tax=Phytophthora nicotianae P1569 TaxID=1317065 RepID=V9FRG2_PHYNI|nr:hypothetical protein F443_03093 [Phytophthora nicotianae P1569]
MARRAAVASINPSASSDNHGKIIAAIADDPRLVRFYLDLCQSTSSKRTAPSDDSKPAQRQRLHAPSELLSFPGSENRPSKHAFAPTTTQLLIHGMITAPEYAARGLSVLHFKHFDFAARRAWYADGSVNLKTFTASVAMPKAGKAEAIDDVANALTVLHLFAEEFFDTHTCRLISGAREFMEELREYCQWNSQNVGTIAFWLDRVLEDYRAATEVDARLGSPTRTKLRDRLSLKDSDLQSALYIIQSERVAVLLNPATRQGKPTHQGRHEGPRRHDFQRNGRKPPNEVIEALPRKGRQTVCMKYLSSGGCVSKSEERCAFPNHAHFLPTELPSVVRDLPFSAPYRLDCTSNSSSAAIGSVRPFAPLPFGSRRTSLMRLCRAIRPA